MGGVVWLQIESSTRWMTHAVHGMAWRRAAAAAEQQFGEGEAWVQPVQQPLFAHSMHCS